MQCMSCRADIPPAWVNAIQRNECPGCGGAIMDEASKELLDELREAMESMPNDPEGLAGWLLSNYKLHKIGTAEPTEFHRKREAQPEHFDGLKVAENPKSVFLQRAGMSRELTRRKQTLAEIAQQVNEAGEEDGTVSVDLEAVPDDHGMDEYEAMALAQQRSAQGSSAKAALHNNSLLIQGDGPPPTSVETEMLSQALGGEAPVDDGSDMHPALQADRYKRLKAQQEVAAGGKVGKIRR